MLQPVRLVLMLLLMLLNIYAGSCQIIHELMHTGYSLATQTAMRPASPPSMIALNGQCGVI
jgi:hypothetical protein